MQYHNICAAITTVLTIVAFLPQIYKTLKSRSAKTLHPVSFIVSYSGSVILSIYSTLERPFVWTTLIVDLSISFLMLPIMFFIFKHRLKHVWRYLFILIAIDLFLVTFFAVTITDTWYIRVPHEATFPIAIVGFALTGFAFFPQTLMVIKNREIGDFSFLLAITYGIAQSLNVAFWLGTYLIDNDPILHWLPGLVLAGISALIQFTTITCVLVYKIQDRKKLAE